MTRATPLLLALTLTAACAKEAAPPAPPAAAPQQVTITANDFGYVLPSTPITAGVTTITLANSGKELHQAQLYRLADGKTVADFTAAEQADGPPPTWALLEGGPNAVLPGQQVTATVTLEPGAYVLLCRVPSADGTPHEMKGMILGLEVQPAAQGAAAAAMPPADIKMALIDYGFSLSQPVTAGAHTFEVKNDAAQPHEVVLIRVPPGGSMDDWKGWLAGGMKTAWPGEPFSGLTAIAPGDTQEFTATFTPGTYGLICFVPDAKDGQPHLLHGMITQFTVS